MPKKTYPFVSLCTPTFNRRPFFHILFKMILAQKYPHKRMEWVIVDDGTDPIKDVIDEFKQSKKFDNINYVRLDKKVTLGKKRNIMHQYCKGSILVYIDDDDYLPPDRVTHSVDTLLNAPNKELLAGSGIIYLYYKQPHGMYKFGPYGTNHCTAGTFAFKRELLETCSYNDDACLAEEAYFLKNYTIPMVKLDPQKTILVFPHSHNTFDKLEFIKEGSELNGNHCKSDKTLDDFIVGDYSAEIKDFFVNKMHKLLEEYKDGSPEMKPDVVKYTKKLEIERKVLQEKQRLIDAEHVIFIKKGDDVEIGLNRAQIVQLIQEQQRTIGELLNRNNQMEQYIMKLQEKIYK